MLESEPDASGQVTSYPLISGTPVVIDFERSVVTERSIRKNFETSAIERRTYTGISRFLRWLISPGKPTTRKNVAELLDLLATQAGPARILVIGGGTIGQGMEPVYTSDATEVFSFDLYKSQHSQFVADAHQLPFEEAVFDAVIIQAVLEHVLDPAQVASEIWRVLKSTGLVYAETPFMQQVHEGAYDFTRFTESGHRYLFRRFDKVRSGASGGPGLQLMWSMDYFVRSLFRSRRAGKVVKLALFWLQHVDALIPESYAIDGASGVYFLGRKSSRSMTPQDAISHYQGAQ